MYDYATCGYYASVAYGDAGTNSYASAQPAVVAYLNRITGLYGLHALFIVDRVLRREELAARTYLAMRANLYLSSVEHDAVIIDERMLANDNSVSVVAMEGRNYC